MKRSTAVKSLRPEMMRLACRGCARGSGVYLVVIISFVLWVALLVALTDFFS